MKKIFILLVITLLLFGCGSKKKNKTTKPEKTVIDLKLGSSDMTFTEDSLTCGNYQVQSKITFNTDNTVSYEFYDCEDNNIILETSEGNYETADLDVTVTNKYDEKLNFEITDNDTIVLKDGNKNIRTFTK